MSYQILKPIFASSAIATLTLLLLLSGCDTVSDANDANGEPDIGEGSFTVSGALDREASGFSEFFVREGGVDNTNKLEIDIFDDPSFTLSFEVFYAADVNQLDAFSEGSYELVSVEEAVVELDGSIVGLYGELDEDAGEDEDDFRTFVSRTELPGTLEITSVSEEEIEGTFSFEAEDTGSEAATVTISEGEFRATRRE